MFIMGLSIINEIVVVVILLIVSVSGIKHESGRFLVYILYLLNGLVHCSKTGLWILKNFVDYWGNG